MARVPGPFLESTSCSRKALSPEPESGTEQIEELEREIRELRNLETARSQFLATVSHELRTPLTAIRTYAEALDDRVLGDLNERQADAVASIRSATDRLLGMVEEILRFVIPDYE